MQEFIAWAANEFADIYVAREWGRWELGDKCASVDDHPNGLRGLQAELEEQHGITLTLPTLQNYARVAKSFSKEHRHLQYKWSYYLECSRHEDPIAAMEMALDNCYSPKQMRNLRLRGDPDYKAEVVIDVEVVGIGPICADCGGSLDHCLHGGPNYKKSETEKCELCGGNLLHCKHKVQDDGRTEVWYHVDPSLCECEGCMSDGTGTRETRRLEQRDEECQGTAEDRSQESAS